MPYSPDTDVQALRADLVALGVPGDLAERSGPPTAHLSRREIDRILRQLMLRRHLVRSDLDCLERLGQIYARHGVHRSSLDTLLALGVVSPAVVSRAIDRVRRRTLPEGIAEARQRFRTFHRAFQVRQHLKVISSRPLRLRRAACRVSFRVPLLALATTAVLLVGAFLSSSLERSLRPPAPRLHADAPRPAAPPSPAAATARPGVGDDIALTAELHTLFYHRHAPRFEAVVRSGGRFYVVSGAASDLPHPDALASGTRLALRGTVARLPGPPARLPDGRQTRRQIRLGHVTTAALR